MSVTEMRDSADARRYLLQGLLAQRLGRFNDESVMETLRWASELAANDEPIPPLGFVADVGQLVLAADVPSRQRNDKDLPNELARTYEDHVPGKLYGDGAFRRACTAACRYPEEDRKRAVAWIIARILDRAGAVGIRCSPSVVRTLQRDSFETLMSEAVEVSSEGIDAIVLEHYTDLIGGFRAVGPVLSTADVFELEQQTALVEFGQRLALRQTLSAFSSLKSSSLSLRPRASGRDRSVVTNLFEEDSYPVGGFTSISTRGTIESLLHSQLAYMEQEADPRPDLFDVKYLRSELLYYSRDENEFLRRKRGFVFALHSDLISARVRDGGLPFQRIVFVLALLYLCVVRLTEWLSGEALTFEVVLLRERDEVPLSDETKVLELLLREQISTGTAAVRSDTAGQLSDRLAAESVRQATHCVFLSTNEFSFAIDNVILTSVIADHSGTRLCWQHEDLKFAGDAGGWQELADQLLRILI